LFSRSTKGRQLVFLNDKSSRNKVVAGKGKSKSSRNELSAAGGWVVGGLLGGWVVGWLGSDNKTKVDYWLSSA